MPDERIVPHVLALNEAGVDTFSSCSGHGNSAQPGYVYFESDEFDPEAASESGVFAQVRRQYCSFGGCWFVGFRNLEEGMTKLLSMLEVELP